MLEDCCRKKFEKIKKKPPNAEQRFLEYIIEKVT
jgi:hypothetical protein